MLPKFQFFVHQHCIYLSCCFKVPEWNLLPLLFCMLRVIKVCGWYDWMLGFVQLLMFCFHFAEFYTLFSAKDACDICVGVQEETPWSWLCFSWWMDGITAPKSTLKSQVLWILKISMLEHMHKKLGVVVLRKLFFKCRQKCSPLIQQLQQSTVEVEVPNGTEQMELNLEYAPVLLGLPQVARQRISTTLLTLIPHFLPYSSSGLGRLEPNHHHSLGKFPKFSTRRVRMTQVMKNPSVWKEWIKQGDGVEEVFPVACHRLGYDILVVSSCSHFTIDAHFFFFFLSNPAMSPHELLYGFPWSGNTSTRYLSTAGLLN